MSKIRKKAGTEERSSTVDGETPKDFIRRHCQVQLLVTFDLSAGTLYGTQRRPLSYERRTLADILRDQLDDLITRGIAEHRVTLASLAIRMPERAKVEITD